VSYSITRSIEFDAGHRVPSHNGRCRNPHGHRYRVEVDLTGALFTSGPEQGMVADFGILKDILAEVTDRYDHAMIVWEGDEELLGALGGHGWRVVSLPLPPTAEFLAQLLYEATAPQVAINWSGQVELERLTVWETPTTSATYTP
jgi:6-pyruvoyltetrahydropterin/6-carboxytetrahydropterin synthase